MRRTRTRKPVVRIVSWETYPFEFVPLAALHLRWGEDIQTLRKWIRVGKLPARRFGRTLRVAKDDARRFEVADLVRVSRT